MNRYNKTEWRNGQAPALSAENLNKIENGLEAVTNEVIKSVQNVQLIGSDPYPNVNSATANDVAYRVFVSGSGSPCGWLRFCGSKNYVDVEVAQIRWDMDGKFYRRKGIANSGTVTWDSAWAAFEPGGGVFKINENTVPESANWGDSIPESYAGQNGEAGELAFWEHDDEFWGIFGVNTDPRTGIIYYDWLKISTEIDISDLKTEKMSHAPINPTAEQIAAMSTGQLYGDTVNHKGTIKGGQSFYDTEYIDTALALKANTQDVAKSLKYAVVTIDPNVDAADRKLSDLENNTYSWVDYLP